MPFSYFTSVHGSFGRLLQLQVLLSQHHVLADILEDVLDHVVVAPVAKSCEVSLVNLQQSCCFLLERMQSHHSVALVDADHVNLGGEADSWWLSRIVRSTLDLKVVDSGLVWRLKAEVFEELLRKAYSWRPDYRGSPSGESHVAVILESPRNVAVSFAFLTLLELFQQTEIPRNID